MASVTSLGLHKPTALTYLIQERLLDANCTRNDYTWQTGAPPSAPTVGDDDELVTTRTSVVWCRGELVRKSFRFEVEEEPVSRALLTYFSFEEQNSLSVIPNIRPSKTQPSATGTESLLGGQAEHGLPRSRKKALVVFLKTQAHIYFLSGTSHVIHLPFEVEYAFAAPNGVVIQRKQQVERMIPTSLKFPRVPPNSFISSQPQPWSANSSVQSTFSVAALGSPKQLSLPRTALLGDLWQTPAPKDDSNWPRLFSLLEPLSEIGLVVTSPNSKQSKWATISGNALDPAEELIHISGPHESHNATTTMDDSVTLAITLNRETSMYTIWRLTYNEPVKEISHSTAVKGVNNPRRRSSFAPPNDSGTATPAVSGPYAFRDSLGGARGSNINGPEDDIEEELGFVSSLDPDFEKNGLPRRKSRRVSSMLARSDLSASHERSAFSDLATSNHQSKRRGDSIGNQNSRTSFGQSVNLNGHTSAAIAQKPSATGLLEAPVDDLLNELRAGGDFEGFLDMGLNDADFGGLRHEIILTKIDSVPLELTNVRFSTQHEPLQSHCKVFTLSAPPSASEDPRKGQIVVCLLDSDEKKLLVVTLNTLTEANLGVASHQGKYRRNLPIIKVTRGEVMRAKGVLDACKLVDGETSRILILTESSDGFGELTLQAPWSPLMKVVLPDKLSVTNMHSLSHNITPQKKREGGFKRVLSNGPQHLQGLLNPMPGGLVDLLDDERNLHQLRIRMQPQNEFVKRILDVCRSVLPGSRGGEQIIVAWWHVMQWLKALKHDGNGREATAMTVALLTLFLLTAEPITPFTRPGRASNVRGPLRSSRGGGNDDTCWMNMMGKLGTNGCPRPRWLTSGAWEWMDEQELLQVQPPKHSNRSLKALAAAPAAPSLLQRHTDLAHDFMSSEYGQMIMETLPTAKSKDIESRQNAIIDVLVGLHLLCEEQKLDIATTDTLTSDRVSLTPILGQLLRWVGWQRWASWYDHGDAATDGISYDSTVLLHVSEPSDIPNVFEWIERCFLQRAPKPFFSIADLTASRSILGHQDARHLKQWLSLTPRTALFSKFFGNIRSDSTSTEVIEALHSAGINSHILDTLPEAILLPLRGAIVQCQAHPPTLWKEELLRLVGRDDVGMLLRSGPSGPANNSSLLIPTHEASVDYHAICSTTTEPEAIGSFDGSAEADRQSITRLIFKDDRRFNEAAKILNTTKPTPALCVAQPDWSESDLLEAQKEHAQMLATRTLSIPSGRGLLYFSARIPLLTEKFPIPAFNLSCIMKPANNTVNIDKNSFTEEKLCWAFFHSGVSAGISISRDAKGIDTSWILFNKPQELSNRHAGFLLALGLNGHLKSVAKWVAFKYLTPKHTMTSIGLLLGLAASYLGTMDSLITRLLSVHVTRMLPPGAAELNLSPLTQTSGIMGIGLLYCNTQHRRMSEIMVSEIEHIEPETEDEPLRNEGYRLASGFALGFINLGKGTDLRGLHDMHLPERLLRLAAGTKKVGLVHILDKATNAAVIAVALIFMKSEDASLARKIDVPDSIVQYDYVRPDVFLLRTIAKHLILWSKISPTAKWIEENLPVIYRDRSKLINIDRLKSADLPLYDIVTGLLFSLSLRHAGSGSIQVRDLLLRYLDQMLRISRILANTYDEKLTRTTVRNCLDLVALSAATVMAGTGDISVFRRLRALHGRDDAETPYGSHFAAHLAIGALFLGGGTYTFGTSNLAIGALLVAFYPLFPTSVLDNKSHLQAFRHFWVLAAEPRCLVARDIDTNQAISLPLTITLKSETQLVAHAPCLLPELDMIHKVQTTSREYWNIVLNFAKDHKVKDAFAKNQVLWLRKTQANNAGLAIFQASLQALDEKHGATSRQPIEWIFDLEAFAMLTQAEKAFVSSPEDGGTSIGLDIETTALDARLMLEKAFLESGKRDRLQGLKLLFAWKEEAEKRGETMGWVSGSVIDGLMAKVSLMGVQGNRE